MLRTLTLAALAGLSTATLADGHDHDASDQRARSVIFIISDGLGVAMASTADVLIESDRPLPMATMPVTGLVRTWSATGVITDSAAGATAYATGYRVPNGSISMAADGTELRSILRDAEDRGMATGLITTTDLTDATPAAFAANIPTRKLHAAIFEQMIDRGVDVLVGGLRTASIQAEPGISKAGDHTLARSLVAMAEAKGYAVIEGPDAAGVSELSDRPTLIVPSEREHKDAFGPPLAETVRPILARLANDPDGFFLVIECEETDTAGHANDLDRTLAGVREVNDALAVALAHQAEHPDTLVVLTADHDTAGLAITSGDYAGGTYETLWISGNHTAQWVPVFASGPGSAAFTGVHDNTALNALVREALGFEAQASASPAE